MPAHDDEELLRSVVEQLAPIPRLPTSPGERAAAELIRDRLAGLGARAGIEEVPARSSYAWPIGMLSALAAGAGLAALRGHRLSHHGLSGHRVIGVVGGALAAAGIVDDISGRWLVGRRTVMRPRTAYNVVAQLGPAEATRTLCVLAHHDAAPSGVVFQQVAQEWLAEHRPDVVERMTSNPPLWWPVIAGPALVALGSATGHRWLTRVGVAASATSLAAMVDIGRRPAVPGANDNLTGVAALVALADRWRTDPVPGLRLLLVSAGAEEALQEGIRGFAARHFPQLPPQRTWFVNLDTIGSGRLVLLEGEGPVRMRDYAAGVKDLVAGCAAAEGIELLRGLRSRNSTDGAVPNRYGYPTATIVSVDHRKLIPHYHLDTDLPEHVDYGCVARAVRLVEAVARKLVYV
ncbi:MAG: Zn-dependent exopeptidase M28 [Actinobacteria bacterium]|nr:MAG: Zn-dependent exopeptidase M28 [Actinomycetota bacterium]